MSGMRGAGAACLLVVLAAHGVPGPGWAQASPGGLTRVGDELTVGRSRTGEECRLRLLESEPGRRGLQRFGLFSEGWTQPSGEIRRFRVARGFPIQKRLTDSGLGHDLAAETMREPERREPAREERLGRAEALPRTQLVLEATGTRRIPSTGRPSSSWATADEVIA